AHSSDRERTDSDRAGRVVAGLIRRSVALRMGRKAVRPCSTIRYSPGRVVMASCAAASAFRLISIFIAKKRRGLAFHIAHQPAESRNLPNLSYRRGGNAASAP